MQKKKTPFNGADAAIDISGIKEFSVIKLKKEEGLIKHFGFSFHGTPELLDKILSEHPEVEIVQIQMNYATGTIR